jgi:hypothetical protein
MKCPKIERKADLDRAVLLAFAAMSGVALFLGLRRNWRCVFRLRAQ